MWKVTENPPLACYYLALASGILGWSELALHSAFLLPALAVVWGTHRLARHFCSQPLLAALATLFTPVVLVSSLTVMCDVLMLAFWVWAVVFWVEGTEQEKFWKLFVAAWLITLAELTKYFGVCLLPLLAAYSVMNKRPVGRWAQFILIPLAVLLAYQLTTQALYGTSLLYRAMDYAVFTKNISGFSKMQECLMTLVFTGGGVATVAIFAPLLWRFRILTMFFGGSVLAAVIFFLGGTIWEKYGLIQSAARAPVEIQFIIWVAGGLSALALVVADVRHRRDTRSCLLALWVLGTFSFAAFVNWLLNERSILPMAPAVGILIARRLERNAVTDGIRQVRAVPICLALGALLALLVARADFLLAVAVRQSAQQTCIRYGHQQKILWFQGHWGFQYYMEAFGASALDFARSPLKAGDTVAIPADNTNLLMPKPEAVMSREMLAIPGPHLLATMNETAGAGFYGSLWGPLPFAFGGVPPESVFVYVLK